MRLWLRLRTRRLSPRTRVRSSPLLNLWRLTNLRSGARGGIRRSLPHLRLRFSRPCLLLWLLPHLWLRLWLRLNRMRLLLGLLAKIRLLSTLLWLHRPSLRLRLYRPRLLLRLQWPRLRHAPHHRRLRSLSRIRRHISHLRSRLGTPRLVGCCYLRLSRPRGLTAEAARLPHRPGRAR
jgi:hypothetical protein